MILVTGATGFLGRHLVPLLLATAEPVRALVRPGTDDGQLRGLGVEVVRGDLLDDEAVRRAAAGCGRVFHLAGLVSHERRDLERLRAVNVEGVRAVLAVGEPGARIVHVASLATIGPAPGPDRPATEDQPFPPEAARLPYVATKREGERLALEAAAARRDVVVANPGFFLGPDDVHRVSTWTVQAYLQGTLRFHVRGGISVVDARDVAAGLLALAERGRAGERYILSAADGNFAWPDFFRRLGEVTGVRRRMIGLPGSVAAASASLVHRPVKPGALRAARLWWLANPAKAQAELGFTTRPLDETIADTAAQYR